MVGMGFHQGPGRAITGNTAQQKQGLQIIMTPLEIKSHIGTEKSDFKKL
jgi:hypothetical protein